MDFRWSSSERVYTYEEDTVNVTLNLLSEDSNHPEPGCAGG